MAKLHPLVHSSLRFRKELKKQMRVAIAAALGFLIAYSWKEYVVALAGDLFTNIQSTMPNMSNFLSALVLTIIGVILIMISSKLLE